MVIASQTVATIGERGYRLNTGNKYAQVGRINRYAFYLTMNNNTFDQKQTGEE